MDSGLLFGIVAFHECDFGLSASMVADQTTPQLYRQAIYWLVEVFRCAGLDLHMGTSLPETFIQAALPQPQMCLDAIVGCGLDWSGYVYIAECLRSTLPLLIKFGITTAQEVNVDTFAERLRAEVIGQHSTVVGPLMIGIWARKA